MRRLAALFILTAGFASAQFGNGYSYSRPIHIDHRRVPSGQTNFPMLISGTYSYLATVANGGKVENSSGFDIIFTSDLAGTTLLNWRMESYTASTGAVIAWVEVPTVSSTVDTTIYVFYGNSGISTFQSPAAPWDTSYKGVWPMGTAGSLALTDLSAAGHNLTNSGSTATAGQIGGAASMAGTGHLDAGTSSDYNPGSGDFTIEMWAKAAGAQALASALAFRGDPSTSAYYLFVDGGNNLYVFANTTNVLSAVGHLMTGAWARIAMTKSGSTYCFYQDNNSPYCATGPGTISISANLWLGLYHDAGNGDLPFNGSIDDARYSNVARSADWLLAEYNNQLTPSTFYTIDSETNPVGVLSCPAASATGMVNFPYSASLTTAGGIPSYTYAITAGALPTGLTLNTGTGVISGTPSTVTGSPFAYTAQVTDSASNVATASCSTAIQATAVYAPRVFGNADSGWYWSGPKTVIAGRDTYYTFFPRWSFPISCDVATQRCDTHGTYSPADATGLVTLSSSGTPPTGLWTIYGNEVASYRICDVVGNTFTLREAGGFAPSDCSGIVQPFTDIGTGILYVRIGPFDAPAISVSSLTGLPTGGTAIWYDTDALVQQLLQGTAPQTVCCGSFNEPMLVLTVPANATPGIRTIAITWAADTSGTNSTVLSFPIDIVAPPTFTATPPVVFPAIPGLSTWVTLMTSDAGPNGGGGGAWCDKTTGEIVPPLMTVDSSHESQPFYYDGARVYDQIAAYTGDTDWLRCAATIASQYADQVLPIRNTYPNGFKGNSPYPMFSRGAALQSTSSTDKYAQLVEYQTRTFNPVSNPGGIPGHNQLREQALQLDADLDYEVILHNQRHPSTVRLAAYIMQQLMSIADDQLRPPGDESFYMGLAMEALIYYWDTTGDPQVPYTIKRTLDYLTLHFDDVTTHSWMYDTAPPGPACSCPGESCPDNIWFVGARTAICNSTADPNRYGVQALNNLVAFAYAWYWSVTGDDTYKDIGDQGFAHALDDPNALFQAKAFNQEYRLSFDYVKYRSGTGVIPGCTFSISPTSKSYLAAGGTQSIALTASDPSCTWVATSTAAWLTLDKLAGTGSDTVTATAAANTGEALNATATIAGRVFTASQASGCTYAIAPSSHAFLAAGESQVVTITTGVGCAWTATSGAGWLTLDVASGTGSGTVTLTAAANAGSSQNTTATIATKTFTATQAAVANVLGNHMIGGARASGGAKLQ